MTTQTPASFIFQLQTNQQTQQFWEKLLDISNESIANHESDAISMTTVSQNNLADDLSILSTLISSMFFGNFCSALIFPTLMRKNPWAFLISSKITCSLGACLFFFKKYKNSMQQLWNKIPLYQIAKSLPITSNFPCVRQGMQAEKLQRIRAAALIDAYKKLNKNSIDLMKSVLSNGSISTTDHNQTTLNSLLNNQQAPYSPENQQKYRQTALNILEELPKLIHVPEMLTLHSQDSRIRQEIDNLEKQPVKETMQALCLYGKEQAKHKKNLSIFKHETSIWPTFLVTTIISAAAAFALARSTSHLLPQWAHIGWQTSSIAAGAVCGCGLSAGTRLKKYLFNVIRRLPGIQEPSPNENKITTLKTNAIEKMKNMTPDQKTAIHGIFAFTATNGYCPCLQKIVPNPPYTLSRWNAQAALPLIKECMQQ